MIGKYKCMILRIRCTRLCKMPNAFDFDALPIVKSNIIASAASVDVLCSVYSCFSCQMQKYTLVSVYITLHGQLLGAGAECRTGAAGRRISYNVRQGKIGKPREVEMLIST